MVLFSFCFTSRLKKLSFLLLKTSYNYNFFYLNKLKSSINQTRRFISISTITRRNINENSDLDLETDASQSAYQALIQEYLILGSGHRVYLIQPEVKWGPQKKTNTTARLQLAEAEALIYTFQSWKIVEKIIVSVKNPNKKLVFGSGNIKMLKEKIRTAKLISGATAVFLNVSMLTGLQHRELEKEFFLPVYDRYTIVLQIFREHARTKEAKLQVSLAEIPYLKSRLRGMHEGGKDKQGGGIQYIGGSGETYLETRRRLLAEREMKLQKSLQEIKMQRSILRTGRVKKEFPVIAVVGYTNAGKTSLIKALTGEDELQPKNQLFATLDVTAHAGVLPNKLTVIFIDTVGFITDIPTDLIESFSATLEDVLLADVIIHVRDLSHPDSEMQRQTVLDILKGLKLSTHLLDNIIEVGNKVDLIGSEIKNISNTTPVSVKTGFGIDNLKSNVTNEVMKLTGRNTTIFRVPMGGEESRWLYKEAAITLAEADEENPQFLLLHTIITEVNLAKYKHIYKEHTIKSISNKKTI